MDFRVITLAQAKLIAKGAANRSEGPMGVFCLGKRDHYIRAIGNMRNVDRTHLVTVVRPDRRNP